MDDTGSSNYELSCRYVNVEISKHRNISGSMCPFGQDFFTLFNTIQDFLFILDDSGKLFFYNRVFQEQLGYTDDELAGKEILELHPPKQVNRVRDAIKFALGGGNAFHDVPLVNAAGNEIAVETKYVLGKWGNKQAIIGSCRDISKTMHYEQQIKQSSERLEMVLLASDAGWWDWKIKTDELTLNEKWCSMRGYKPDEIAGTVDSWKSNVHPDDLPHAFENLQKHFRKKTPFYQAEYRAKTKSGDYIWILDTGKVIETDENGDPLRVAGTNIDITTHKVNEIKLQKNLRQQELLSEIALELNSLENFDRRIQNILAKIGEHTDVSRVYIFEDTPDGTATNNTFEWCNHGVVPQISELQDIPYEIIPSWRKILLEKGRIYSENIAELPEDTRIILEPQGIKSIIIYPLIIKQSFFGFIGFDECLRHKNWTKSELELLRTFTGIIANAYERSISEKSLQESEARNRAILQSIPDILFQFNQEGRILSYRSSSLDDLAFQPDHFMNKTIAEIFPEEFSVRIREAIKTCLEKGSYRLDYEMPVNGELNDYEARLVRMNDNELIAIVRNVSERKKYERQLTEERDKANQANKAKSEFLANMSHEIRTPMNAILGFSEALYHKLESPQQQKMIRSVLSSGNLLLSLLNDILDLSKIEAGMLEISHQPVDLQSIIREIKLLFQSKADKKNLEINMFFPPELPRYLMLDEIRIKQVIFNLVGNAIKFTHAGYVNIKVSFLHGEYSCGQLKIDVEDTGIGIPETEQEVIFETFRQQSGQSNRLYEGAGLGLAISKRLVEKMHGTISVASVVGKGSVFTVVIPSALVESQVPVSDSSADLADNITFEPAGILVVDDVSANIEAVESLLDGTGLKVIPAENGEIALELVRYASPSLVLLDLRMPVMNGYEVAQRIKEDPNVRNIPVIAYTASVFGSEHGLQSGNFDGILYKPVNRGALFRELMRFLKYTSAVRPGKTQEPVFDPESLPAELTSKLPDFYRDMMKSIYPKWDEIRNQLVLFRIEEFANELKALAENYQFDYLTGYANRLIAELEMVDLESISESLTVFPEITEKIYKYINTSI